MDFKTEKKRLCKIGTELGIKILEALAQGLLCNISVTVAEVGNSLVDASQQVLNSNTERRGVRADACTSTSDTIGITGVREPYLVDVSQQLPSNDAERHSAR